MIIYINRVQIFIVLLVMFCFKKPRNMYNPFYPFKILLNLSPGSLFNLNLSRLAVVVAIGLCCISYELIHSYHDGGCRVIMLLILLR